MRRAAPAISSRACSRQRARGRSSASTVVVENRAGASGAIAAQSVAIGPPGRPHAAGRPDARDRHQPALAQGPNFDVETRSSADRARPAWCRSRSWCRRRRPMRRSPACCDGAHRTQGPAVRLRRHRHARPFRRRGAAAQDQRQHDPRALQGRRPRAQRSARRPCRFLFSGISRRAAARQGRHHEACSRCRRRRRSAIAPDVPTVTEVDRHQGFRFHAVGRLLRAARRRRRRWWRGSMARSTTSWRSPTSRKRCTRPAPTRSRCRSMQFTAFMRARKRRNTWRIIQETGIKPE